MCWCPSVMSGLQLPGFAAAEGGLFAEQGLEVEFVRGGEIADWTLPGFANRVEAVASGHADFALTAVAYVLSAQTDCGGRLPVRFVAISHQRNPTVALVRADSDLHEPADLQGARVARWSMPWYASELTGALAHLGLESPVIVDTGGRNLDAALGRGEVDVIPTWMDWLTFYDRNTVVPVRIIPLDIEVYATGLIAADRLPLELVIRMRDAFAAGHDLHKNEPEVAIAGFRRFFPEISEEHIRANWSLFEPYAFDRPPGSMDQVRWRDTIAHTAETHGLVALPEQRLYRPELLDPATKYSPT